jgi:hypothetical protein
MHLARPRLLRRGVHYAGPDRHAVIAAQAAIEEPGPGVQRSYPVARWHALLSEIARHRTELVVLSSEWFADAEPAAIRRIVDELGGGRVHVVVTLRPLVRLLPSQWQQYVAAGSTIGYEGWLESVFGRSGTVVTPTFWHRHRHDQLVDRWQTVVGADGITVVVVDEVDRRAILEAFEALTGLETGSLVAEADRANRSLTAPEAELLRATNARLDAEIRDANLRLNLGLYGVGAALRLREPGRDEPRIETPAWAVERAFAVGREIVAGIERSGVRVIGDLDSLGGRPGAGTATPGAATHGAATPAKGPADVDWPGIVAAAAVGALTAAGLARTGRDARGRLEPLSNERLARVVVHRLRSAAANRLRPVRPAAAGGSRDLRAARPSREVASPAVEAVLARFAGALRDQGLSATLYDSVTNEGVIPELRRLEPHRLRDDPVDWPGIGAAFVVGIIRASGLIPDATGRSRRRLPPPRARIETLEVAGVSTRAVALELGRRALVGIVPTKLRRTT